jgi:hypothetical protein
MVTLPYRLLDPAPLKSDYFSLTPSGWNCFRLDIHFYEFASPGGTELRKVNPHSRGRTYPFSHQSCQNTQQKCHRTDAQQCQRNFHNVTGTLFSEMLLNTIVHPRA